MNLYYPATIHHPSTEEIEGLEKVCLGMDQVDCPLVHQFAPGVYLREITMPAGAFVIGQRHKTAHFNIVLSGRARVMMDDGVVYTIQAPCTFKSEPGVRKILLIEEEMRWATVHPTQETDLNKLEDELVIKSPAFLEHEHAQLLEQIKKTETTHDE